MKIGTFVKAMLPMLAAVIAAGFLLKWGVDNDIPVLKEAANGFDQ